METKTDWKETQEVIMILVMIFGSGLLAFLVLLAFMALGEAIELIL